MADLSCGAVLHGGAEKGPFGLAPLCNLLLWCSLIIVEHDSKLIVIGHRGTGGQPTQQHIHTIPSLPILVIHLVTMAIY
jgi:hypothetical protein